MPSLRRRRLRPHYVIYSPKVKERKGRKTVGKKERQRGRKINEKRKRNREKEIMARKMTVFWNVAQ
jgi:hypothetical protein